MGQVIPFPATPPAWPDDTTGFMPAESAFLIALRWWVTGYRGDEDPVPRLCQGFKHAGARDAAFPLNEFMAIAARTTRKRIAIHAPRCHCFSVDELHLIFAASHAQAGDRVAVEHALRTALALDFGAALAVRPLEELGQIFATADLIFPRRRVPAWEPSSTEAAAGRQPPDTVRTLH